ncbi:MULTISPECIES: hypothetical protein [Mycobacteriaceae]|uniref:Uncharacterized protein n=1 Tax=Mycolicibacterium lutetiense TaxID=1641992 RepID=A0ABS4ZQX8_9MYCO|nr:MULTISPECIES: hypothetical protein [Mycobacteriaceae]MBP2451904.1 hypothetical protein [Mycolicibacterium lutetiense]
MDTSVCSAAAGFLVSAFGDVVASAAEDSQYKVSPTERGFDIELDTVNAK